MKITKLSLTNVRAFERADFEFTSGMNLLVGLNGLGKTTVLDCLRTMLSQVLPHANRIRGDSLAFEIGDIRVGTDALSAEVKCEVPGAEIVYTVHKPREEHIAKATGSVRGDVTKTPEKRPLSITDKDGRDIERLDVNTQLVLFFSTRRSLPSDSRSSSRKSGGERGAALAEALSHRELRLASLAYWMESQRQLGKEDRLRLRHLSALRRAAVRFLPDCKNLRAEIASKARLLVDKKVHGRKSTLDVRQLSDGERSTLALVLDLAQRLSQARPDLADPIKKGEAVVLIDELDLHLHPQWQRTIVDRLTGTFPGCQFIATTHSPQIVAAVEPEQVMLLTDKGVIRPNRTLGMDSNWILRHLMETDERPAATARAIEKVEALISKGAYAKARKQIATYRKTWSDLPDWAVLETRMLRMEALAK
jgi:predicted ATP-binding protein involved in virulence